MIREIRPDWDLTVPGLRENWKADDHSMHHSYQAIDRRQHRLLSDLAAAWARPVPRIRLSDRRNVATVCHVLAGGEVGGAVGGEEGDQLSDFLRTSRPS